jgi:Mrp family chromosome partitioning ATPase
LLLDFMSRSVRTAAQIEHLGLECIGFIPKLRRSSASRTAPLMPQHEAREGELLPHAMLDQTVRRAVAAAESAKVRVIGVASALAGDGATMVAQRFAQSIVCARKRTLLVDVSRIAPSLFTDGKASLAYCDQNCLDAYDVIVVALPPLERGAEFRMAAQGVEGILLVLKWGSTDLEEVARSVAASGVRPSEFLGAILNMVDERMVGKFGDKLWLEEAKLAARRRPLTFQNLPIG